MTIAILIGVKLAKIPDIRRVTRLGTFLRLCTTSSTPGVVVFDDFNSHGYSPGLVKRLPRMVFLGRRVSLLEVLR